MTTYYMSRDIYLGLDPGGTTGWGMYNPNGEKDIEKFSCGQLGPGSHHEDLWCFLEESRPQWKAPDSRSKLWIICESFQYRNGLTKAELDSCEYIGIVKLFRVMFWNVEVVFQTAAQGKITEGSFVKKRHLQKLDLWIPGNKHAMDGYGHLLYYAINGGNPDLAELRMEALTKGWKE
jgi:hypothetical protein